MATMGDSIRMAQVSGKQSTTPAPEAARNSAAKASGLASGSISSTVHGLGSVISIPIALALIAIFYANVNYGSGD